MQLFRISIFNPFLLIFRHMLTFEAIRQVERSERENKKIQKLPDGLFDQVREYLHQKEKNKEKSSLDVLEVSTIKSTLQRLMELREKKIVDAAIITSRTGIPVENLAKEETDFYNAVVESLRLFKENIFETMKKGGKTENYVVKKSLPAFVGPDMKVYNLRENDILTIPKDLASLLMKNNVVEEVKENE